ncbi:MAG TPA: feruloyl-CoA synthase [Stellaceae bacterium]|jgi:feruloyl-CoA synthase|nr:feruloyl-CoA synthase [Stellaceae bacterium]
MDASARDGSGKTLPLRDVRLGSLDVAVDRRPDGTVYLKNKHPLGDYATRITDPLLHWARVAPNRVFMAERRLDGEWQKLSYAEALAQIRRLASALRARGLSAERPLMILSGNDLDHAVLGLAALYAGIPYVPLSPAYSLVSRDFGKLRHIVGLTTPGLVFASDGDLFGRAIAATISADVGIVVRRNPLQTRPTSLLSDLRETQADPAIDAVNRGVGPDTVAKILFTSGSTGMPKGVINTQRMLCANQEQLRTHFAFFRDQPPVILDWSPWNHTAGGNHNFNMVLFNGGTFYIDDGRPVPGAIEATVRNLREVSPTWYFNVPRGYDALIPFLRQDEVLRRSFFKDLRILYYAAASMAQHVWDALDEIASATYGERILMLTGLGSTETAPFALSAGKGMSAAGLVGLPTSGIELKLVPSEGKLEARIRGPNVTPGYWRQPGLTATAFDEEGYYKFGDALRFADPDDVTKGLVFDGRVVEDFKLASGTWVNVGPLRAGFIDHFAPLVQDVVIAGLGRNEIAVLVFPDRAACQRLCPSLAAGAAPREVFGRTELRAAFAERLESLAARSTGSSNRIVALMLLEEPPSLDQGEMTDKGSINQRAVLSQRAALVEELYAHSSSPRVIRLTSER